MPKNRLLFHNIQKQDQGLILNLFEEMDKRCLIFKPSMSIDKDTCKVSHIALRKYKLFNHCVTVHDMSVDTKYTGVLSISINNQVSFFYYEYHGTRHIFYDINKYKEIKQIPRK